MFPSSPTVQNLKPFFKGSTNPFPKIGQTNKMKLWCGFFSIQVKQVKLQFLPALFQKLFSKRHSPFPKAGCCGVPFPKHQDVLTGDAFSKALRLPFPKQAMPSSQGDAFSKAVLPSRPSQSSRYCCTASAKLAKTMVAARCLCSIRGVWMAKHMRFLSKHSLITLGLLSKMAWALTHLHQSALPSLPCLDQQQCTPLSWS